MSGDDLLGAALAELVAIRDELGSTDDLARRIVLTERRNQIRARWAQGLGDLSLDQLSQMESTLCAQRDDVMSRWFDIASAGVGSGDGGGIDPLIRMQHKRCVNEEFGMADIEGELRNVKAEINRRQAI